jgi:hypothetical protein
MSHWSVACSRRATRLTFGLEIGVADRLSRGTSVLHPRPRTHRRAFPRVLVLLQHEFHASERFLLRHGRSIPKAPSLPKHEPWLLLNTAESPAQSIGIPSPASFLAFCLPIAPKRWICLPHNAPLLARLMLVYGWIVLLLGIAWPGVEATPFSLFGKTPPATPPKDKVPWVFFRLVPIP